MYTGCHGQCPLCWSDLNETLIFSTHVPLIFKYQISWKSVHWEPNCYIWTKWLFAVLQTYWKLTKINVIPIFSYNLESWTLYPALIVETPSQRISWAEDGDDKENTTIWRCRNILPLPLLQLGHSMLLRVHNRPHARAHIHVYRLTTR
jgi:hypothetical protein